MKKRVPYWICLSSCLHFFGVRGMDEDNPGSPIEVRFFTCIGLDGIYKDIGEFMTNGF
jgi:hypothetical protein